MAVQDAPPTHKSVVDILRAVLSDVLRFAKAEFALVKAEGADAAKRVAVGAGFVAAALVLLFLFLIFALGAGAVAVGNALDHPWLGWLIFAGGFLLFAVLLVFLGIRRIKRGITEGKGAFTTVKEDLEWVRQLPTRNANEN